MKKVLEKLKSRKMWACLIGVAVGVAAMLGVEESTVSTIAGAVTSVLSVMTYIVTEGKIDAAAVKNAAQQAEDAVQKVREEA